MQCFYICLIPAECARNAQSFLKLNSIHVFQIHWKWRRKVSTKYHRGIRLDVLEWVCALISSNLLCLPLFQCLDRVQNKREFFLTHSEWHLTPCLWVYTNELFFCFDTFLLCMKPTQFSHLNEREKKSRYDNKVCVTKICTRKSANVKVSVPLRWLSSICVCEW